MPTLGRGEHRVGRSKVARDAATCSFAICKAILEVLKEQLESDKQSMSGLHLVMPLDEEDECQVIGLMVGHKDDSEENCCVHATQTTKGLVVLASLTRSLQGSKSMKSDTTSRDSF